MNQRIQLLRPKSLQTSTLRRNPNLKKGKRETPFLSLISAAILILQSSLLFLPILVHFAGREARFGGSNATHLHDVWVRSPASLQRRRS
ncbi:hypothetical protein LR48_Vigan272s000300 [Vigna angularis]|uniref:Transmembrane protein n=1 Tax=Phaseolus angularis TaxID=3914 RepID=A0A0L9T740_PHAAN|nr:hypothetical protein LR48_Vigan272s000300 [Vigna angularis]